MMNLNFYCGRADTALDWKSLLGQKSGHTILIVPDQATLQTERTIIESLGVPGLIDIEAISFSRLGQRIFSECGGLTRKYIDDRGRHMLLAKIISESKDRLQIFGRASASQTFISMMAAQIAEFKQFNTRPEDLAGLSGDSKSLLHRKLTDIALIFERYEREIKGKYTDTEDQISLYTSKIKDASLIRETDFWVWGFDYYTPKTLGILEQLMLHARSLHVPVSLAKESDPLFAPGEKAVSQLSKLAKLHGITVNRYELDSIRSMPPDLAHIEKSLFTYPTKVYAKKPESIQVTECSNYYTEAETAAAQIMRLTRDEGLRFKDIAVICNDMDVRGKMIKRTFADYDIPCFIDKKRNVMHSKFAGFVLALLRIVHRNYRYEDVFRLLKTGLLENQETALQGGGGDRDTGNDDQDTKRGDRDTGNGDEDKKGGTQDAENGDGSTGEPTSCEKNRQEETLTASPISDSRCEKLENYALRYQITGNKWRKDFTYGTYDAYGNVSADLEQELEAINQTRRAFMTFMNRFEKTFQSCHSVRQKSEALYYFLRDDARIPDMALALTEELKAAGAHEYALETAQVWNVIVATLEQAAELSGDLRVDEDTYIQMLTAGFEAEEVGVIPSTMDQVIVGTLQRTRTGRLKALLIMGFNDGVWPGRVKDGDLLHEHEKQLLLKNKEDICKSDRLRMEEEQLAIYRMFTSPSNKLFLSFSLADTDGREIRPSILYGRLREIFPEVDIQKDIVNQEEPQALLAAAKGSFKYVTESLRRGLDGEKMSELMKAAYNWYNRQPFFSGKMEIIRQGLFHANETENLTQAQVKELYRKGSLDDMGLKEQESGDARAAAEEKKPEGETFILSPSQLEIFSRCPFSHLLRYGIKPVERKIFEIASPELGEIFHAALLAFSEEATASGSWNQMAQGENAFAKIAVIVDSLTQSYREGLLLEGKSDAYRVERIKRVCGKTAKAIAAQIDRGIESFNRFYFEALFGRKGVFHGLRVNTGGEMQALIEGRIDRVDVLEKENGIYVKVVDYKSGNDYFDTEEAKMGWKLQLMLYLQAAMQGIAAKNPAKELIPAGVFYFGIGDPTVTIGRGEKMETAIQKQFKLDGVLLHDEAVILGMDPNMASETGYSDVIPVQRSKSQGGFVSASKGRKQLLDRNEFDQFIQSMEKLTEEVCDNLMKGTIDIRPKKLDNNKSACTWCPYRFICHYR